MVRNLKVIILKILYYISPLIDDRIYLELIFYLRVGHKLNLKNPKTYNEKLQWLKLYYRKPFHQTLVDKFEVKQYVTKKIGEKYIVENYGVWDSFDEIDFQKLPKKFVLKTTHDQGGVILCENKEEFDYKGARKKLTKHLGKNLYYRFREWPYKEVKPRILAEKFLNNNDCEIDDYKFFCFHGEPKLMFISTERSTKKTRFNFFDMNFKPLDITRGYGKSDKIIEKPRQFELMVDISKKLSVGLPHVRVDFYIINEEVFFGEYTFFSGGGLKPFSPKKWDHMLGSYLQLPKENIKN